jgi:starch synthase (maltosyl-transferring)
LVLAATLSSNYGIYGPVFELCVQDALPGREEYLDSEKYEIRHWNRNQDGNISTFIKQVNRIRKENTALQNTNTIRFHALDNPNLICYDKISDDKENHLLVVVNLDPHYRQSGWVDLPLEDLHIPVDQPFMVHDLFTDEKYIWQGPRNYIELDPQKLPAHIFRIYKGMRKEQDFDYFM